MATSGNMANKKIKVWDDNQKIGGKRMQENIFMSCDDIAKLLTIKVSTIYAWIHFEQLPKGIYVKLGRKPIFFKEKVINWIMSGANLNPKVKKGNRKNV